MILIKAASESDFKDSKGVKYKPKSASIVSKARTVGTTWQHTSSKEEDGDKVMIKLDNSDSDLENSKGVDYKPKIAFTMTKPGLMRSTRQTHVAKTKVHDNDATSIKDDSEDDSKDSHGVNNKAVAVPTLAKPQGRHHTR